MHRTMDFTTKNISIRIYEMGGGKQFSWGIVERNPHTTTPDAGMASHFVFNNLEFF